MGRSTLGPTLQQKRCLTDISKGLFRETDQLMTESRQQLSVSVSTDLCGWPSVHVQYTRLCMYLLGIHASSLPAEAWGYEAADTLLLSGYQIQQPLTLSSCQAHSVISFCHMSPSKPNEKRKSFSRASNTHQPCVRL